MKGYENLIKQVHEFTNTRLQHYFNKCRNPPDASGFCAAVNKASPFGEIIEKYRLSGEEQLLLALVLMPHLDHDFYSRIIQKVLFVEGDVPFFGVLKGKNHGGFIPTGETAVFLIAGTDLKKRLEMIRLLSNSRLIKDGILSIDQVMDNQPIMSGKLVLLKEYAELFLTEKVILPSLSPDFPAKQIETKLEWNDLVLTKEVLDQIAELKAWIKHNDRKMDELEIRRKQKPGYRVLFHGSPGTGKTLTASLLGKDTGRPVFRVDLSTIVSKYIGETEKNLSKLIDKAEKKDWILFFDEADALFGKRTKVSDSHDRYANQEISYLMQRTITFSGLVIFSVNCKSNLDETFLRYFNSIIKFELPNKSMHEPGLKV